MLFVPFFSVLAIDLGVVDGSIMPGNLFILSCMHGSVAIAGESDRASGPCGFLW